MCCRLERLRVSVVIKKIASEKCWLLSLNILKLGDKFVVIKMSNKVGRNLGISFLNLR